MNSAAVNISCMHFPGTGICTFLPGVYLGMELLGHKVQICSSSLANVQCFPECFYKIQLPTALVWDSGFNMWVDLGQRLILCLFYISLSGGCLVVSNYSLVCIPDSVGFSLVPAPFLTPGSLAFIILILYFPMWCFSSEIDSPWMRLSTF